MKTLLAGYIECGYCHEPKKGEGWHDCTPAQEGYREVMRNVRELYERRHGGNEYWATKDQVKNLSTVASQIVVTGGEVSEEGKAVIRRGYTR